MALLLTALLFGAVSALNAPTDLRANFASRTSMSAYAPYLRDHAVVVDPHVPPHFTWAAPANATSFALRVLRNGKKLWSTVTAESLAVRYTGPVLM
jgi:hypothetical protein